MRRDMKERQEASVRRRQQDKLREWAEWEQQTASEERKRRQQSTEDSQQPAPGFQWQQQYQQQYQASEGARRSEEARLDAVQAELRERVRQRQRRSDRWMPPETASQVARKVAAEAEAAAQAQARAAAREARRAAQAASAPRQLVDPSDGVAAAGYVRSRLRSKISRFADLVVDMQQAQQERQAGAAWSDPQDLFDEEGSDFEDGLVRVVRGAPSEGELQTWEAQPGQSQQQQWEPAGQQAAWQGQSSTDEYFQPSAAESGYSQQGGAARRSGEASVAVVEVLGQFDEGGAVEVRASSQEVVEVEVDIDILPPQAASNSNAGGGSGYEDDGEYIDW